jgi:hypothetical protein
MFWVQVEPILASIVNKSSRLKKRSVDLIVQSLPPVHDAIGEYPPTFCSFVTTNLAESWLQRR